LQPKWEFKSWPDHALQHTAAATVVAWSIRVLSAAAAVELWRTPAKSVARASSSARNRLVVLHGLELAKKLVAGLAAFEVVEQRLDRDSSTDEHRDAPEGVRVAVHDVP
jgi:hypothetical protein